jgi:hypothetical protein
MKVTTNCIFNLSKFKKVTALEGQQMQNKQLICIFNLSKLKK